MLPGMRWQLIPIAAVLASAGCSAQSATKSNTPVELGAIAWQRDFDAAVETAKQVDRPILLLFQEVPG